MSRPSPSGPPTPPTDERRAIGFASFAIDLRGGRLTCAGQPVPLRPKTWAVLLYLVQRPGTLITRDELLDAVWSDVAVTPDTLTKSIGELRTALGGDPKHPRYIETVHRRGFRFLATPQPVSAGIDPAGASRDGTLRPFVGRDAELHRLGVCFERACGGERQMVFVSGPAGVGKTALVETFLGAPALRDRAAVVGWGASIEVHGMHEPYMPVLEALERLARGPDGPRLLTLLHATAPSWLAQMPWLAGDDAALLYRSLQAARPERMLRECVALVEALGADIPLVLALDDLHWSDPSTVDLFARLGQRHEPARLLVIGTYRSAEVAVHDHPLGPTVRALRGQRRCIELPLHELSVTAVRDYLAVRFSGAAVPPALGGILHGHTDGNPLFLRAVIDHMVAQGWILDTAPGWSFDAMPARPEFGVPDDARDLVALQIRGLAPADRQLLEAAGVAGRECTAPILAAASDRPVTDVETSCETLARGERFLRPIVGSPVLRYAFTHELYRQAVYYEIPPDRRQRLHLRIGRALEASLGERAADLAPELALHFEESGDIDRALHYLPLAATRARQRLAPREASGYLEHALTLLERIPDAPDRRQRELELRLALAPLLNEQSGPASAALKHTCERALELCDDADKPHRRFQILYALCHVYSMRGDGGRLDGLAASLSDVAQQLGGGTFRILAASVHCRVAVHRAHFAAACGYAEGILTATNRDVPPPHAPFGADPVVATRTHYALGSWMLGEVERARAALRDAELAVAPAEVPPFTKASVAFFGALLDMLDGDADRTHRSSEAAVRLAEEHGLTIWLIMASALRGWARVHLGQIDAGIDELRRARTAHAEAGNCVFTTYILAFLAEAYLRTGDVPAGLQAVDEALQIAETTLDRSYAPELWRLKGELLRAAGGGHRGDAEACLERAIAVARESRARALELRAAVSLARHWHATGRSATAATLLVDALRGFADDLDTHDLRAARALLEKCTASGRRP